MKKLLIALAMALVLVGGVMGATQSSTATVTVNQFLSVTIDDATITFGFMDPLQTKKPTNDPLVATIGVESNVNASVGTKADTANFACTGGGCGSATFAVSNMEWDIDSVFPGTDYTTSNVQVCGNVGAGGTCSIYHELTIPSAQKAGTYNVGITITATSV